MVVTHPWTLDWGAERGNVLGVNILDTFLFSSFKTQKMLGYWLQGDHTPSTFANLCQEETVLLNLLPTQEATLIKQGVGGQNQPM